MRFKCRIGSDALRTLFGLVAPQRRGDQEEEKMTTASETRSNGRHSVASSERAKGEAAILRDLRVEEVSFSLLTVVFRRITLYFFFFSFRHQFRNCC